MSDTLNDFFILLAAWELIEWVTASAMMIFWTGGLVAYFNNYRWQGVMLVLSTILVYWHHF